MPFLERIYEQSLGGEEPSLDMTPEEYRRRRKEYRDRLARPATHAHSITTPESSVLECEDSDTRIETVPDASAPPTRPPRPDAPPKSPEPAQPPRQLDDKSEKR